MGTSNLEKSDSSLKKTEKEKLEEFIKEKDKQNHVLKKLLKELTPSKENESR